MKITAITRLKHGEIFETLRTLNWSVKDLAQKSGVSYRTLIDVINLKKKPTAEIANKIQAAFGSAGVYFDVASTWPDVFVGLESGYSIETTCDVDFEKLLNGDDFIRIDDEFRFRDTDKCRRMEIAIGLLQPRQQQILESHAVDGKTFDEIAKELGVSHSRVSQIFQTATHKVRQAMSYDSLMGHDPEFFDV